MIQEAEETMRRKDGPDRGVGNEKTKRKVKKRTKGGNKHFSNSQREISEEASRAAQTIEDMGR